MQPTNLDGRPYTPAKPRSWLNDAHRADLARQFGCEASQVECCLDQRERSEAYIRNRMAYERGIEEVDLSISLFAQDHAEGRIGATPIKAVAA